MKVLSIDPGVDYAAWARLNKDEEGIYLLGCGVALKDEWREAARALGPLGRVHTIVCERPVLRAADGQKRADTIIRLAMSAATFVTICEYEIFSSETRYVKPEKWKGQIPKPKRASEEYIVERRARARIVNGMDAIVSAAVKRHGRAYAYDIVDAVGIGVSHLLGRRL